MPPQTEFLHPKGAWYLEKYIDDVMEPFPEEAPSTEGNMGLWTQPVIFQLYGSGLSFSLPPFSAYELMILLLSLKYYIGILESEVNFVKLYERLKNKVAKIQQ